MKNEAWRAFRVSLIILHVASCAAKGNAGTIAPTLPFAAQAKGPGSPGVPGLPKAMD
jgi:hypothetical protein